MELEWDEAKRQSNLRKHGLDFADARWVLQSAIRLDVESSRQGQPRTQSIAYVFDLLAVLAVVHTAGQAIPQSTLRIVSFRKASTQERLNYHEWLAQAPNDPSGNS